MSVPILGIASRDNDFDDKLLWSRLGDGNIFDHGLQTFGDLYFLHLGVVLLGTLSSLNVMELTLSVNI